MGLTLGDLSSDRKGWSAPLSSESISVKLLEGGQFALGGRGLEDKCIKKNGQMTVGPTVVEGEAKKHRGRIWGSGR